MAARAMKMPFGKYRDWMLDELPDDYLGWLLSQENIPVKYPHLHKALCDERERRERPDPEADMVHRIIETGYKTLAKTYHPDVGGETKDMQALNHSVEWLRITVKSFGM